jgi:hypothetical protein
MKERVRDRLLYYTGLYMKEGVRESLPKGIMVHIVACGLE